MPEVLTISSVIIDGYILIGISHDNLGTQRDHHVSLLMKYKKIKDHDITVVFDGWKSGGYREESFVTGGVRVIYSRLGEKADAVIRRIVCSKKKVWIVVSSDKDIIEQAWSCGSVPIASSQFLSRLEQVTDSISGEFYLLEEDDHSARRKGNPRQLSKKEKAIMRALRKL